MEDKRNRIILYGMGKLAFLAKDILTSYSTNNEVIGIMDAVLDGRLNIFDMSNEEKDKYLVGVCISSFPYKESLARLRDCGWTKVLPVWRIIEKSTNFPIKNGWNADPTKKENEYGVRKVYNGLVGNGSKDSYDRFTLWRFGLSLEEPIVQARPNLGILLSLRSDCESVISRRNTECDKWKNVWTFHNEGLELRALKIHMSEIKKEKPILAVACYHSGDGLYKIQEFLMDKLSDEYDFYFWCHAYMGQAAFLYCVPHDLRHIWEAAVSHDDRA